MSKPIEKNEYINIQIKGKGNYSAISGMSLGEFITGLQF
ncbi:MAG: hypothetical protein H6Q64_1272, partial [Firmicutes bacterium]|nr:hypothetical protein [Bacillota bacterium]